jgi:hypothetical protein
MMYSNLLPLYPLHWIVQDGFFGTNQASQEPNAQAEPPPEAGAERTL